MNTLGELQGFYSKNGLAYLTLNGTACRSQGIKWLYLKQNVFSDSDELRIHFYLFKEGSFSVLRSLCVTNFCPDLRGLCLFVGVSMPTHGAIAWPTSMMYKLLLALLTL